MEQSGSRQRITHDVQNASTKLNSLSKAKYVGEQDCMGWHSSSSNVEA